MKYFNRILALFAVLFGVVCGVHAVVRDNNYARMIAPFFAKNLKSRIVSDAKLERVLNMISQRDVKGFKEMVAADFIFDRQSKMGMVGNITKEFSFILISENALFFVLLHAALNESPEDDASTLAMLDVLLEKGLSISPQSGIIYIDPNKAENSRNITTSLVAAAIEFTFPEAFEKLLKAGASFTVGLISAMRQEGKEDIAKLLEKYKGQAK